MAENGPPDFPDGFRWIEQLNFEQPEEHIEPQPEDPLLQVSGKGIPMPIELPLCQRIFNLHA